MYILNRDLLHAARATDVPYTLSRRRLLQAAGVLALVPGTSWAQGKGDVLLRIGDQKGGTQSVMKAAGALADLSYRIEWSQFSAAAPLLEALNAGAVDTGFAGDAPTTFALAAGLQGKVIAATRGTGASTAIVVPQQSPIQTIADLKGKTIGTNRGSWGHTLVLAVAEAQGWRPSDYKIANLLPAEAKAAMNAGAIDAWCSWGVYIAQACLVDKARIIVDGRNGLMTGLSYQIATDTAIARDHSTLLDFVRRVAIARRWAQKNPDAYASVLAAEIGVSLEVARLTFETDIPLPLPIDAQVVADQQRVADRYTAAGVIHSRQDATTGFDRSFNSAVMG